MKHSGARPRVLHLIDTGGPGGAETVYCSLARYCEKRGLNAAVTVPYDGWLAERLRSYGIRPVVLPLKSASFLALVREIASLARRSGANIIQTHLLGSGTYGALAGMMLRIPVVATFHGATDLAGSGSFEPVKRWLLNSRHVAPVAVSRAVLDAMTDWRLKGERIRLVLNGVDTEEFCPVGMGTLHEELGLGSSARIVGAVGNIRPPKSYEILLAASRVVVGALPDTHFVIAGSGSDSDLAHLRLIVKQIGLQSHVHFLGFRQSSTDLYRSFSVFASSASTEGLPLSFLEAMSCAIPIAATANEGASKLLQDTGAGLLSPVGDHDALARSLIRILDDNKLAESLGRRGRTAVSRRFGLESSLAEYVRTYECMLARQ